MGKDIYEEYASAKKIYDEASKILGIDVAGICFEDEERLNKTENTQIAILVTSLAILEVLRENGIEAKVATGLSLGEYTALIHSKIISFEEGIKLVRKRGELMQNLVPEGNWKMVAVLGLNSEKIEEVCKQVNEEIGFVVPANYNYSGQTVVSGEEKAVEEVSKRVMEEGAKKAILLNTSGPFHTNKLENARKEFEKELEKIQINNLEGKIEIIKNITGTPYKKEDNIKEILAKHMISPIRFDKTIRYFFENNIDTFVEIGPGKTLTGFIKKENVGGGDLKTYNINNVETLKEFIKIM